MNGLEAEPTSAGKAAAAAALSRGAHGHGSREAEAGGGHVGYTRRLCLRKPNQTKERGQQAGEVGDTAGDTGASWGSLRGTGEALASILTSVWNTQARISRKPQWGKRQ